MTEVLVRDYSAYGHIEQRAQAVADGALGAGADVDIKRIPELAPRGLAVASHFELDQPAPIAAIEDRPNYDAVISVVGARFGRMASEMASLLDQAGGLWARAARNGKVGGAFTASATTHHGDNEITLFSIIANLMHFGGARHHGALVAETAARLAT